MKTIPLILFLCLRGFAQSGPPMPPMARVEGRGLGIVAVVPIAAPQVIAPPAPTNILFAADGRGNWRITFPDGFNQSNYLWSLDYSTDLVNWARGDAACFDYWSDGDSLVFPINQGIPAKFYRLHGITNDMKGKFPP